MILAASHAGFPLSTTHVISGGDHGRRRRQARLGGALGRGGQHRRRLGAHAARVRAVGALTYGVVHLFGDGAAGPVVVSAVLLIALGVAMARRVGAGQTLTAEG